MTQATNTTPQHYEFPISPLEYIDANGLDFTEGNIVKYVTRWRKKDGLRDLEKLKDYANKLYERELARETRGSKQ